MKQSNRLLGVSLAALVAAATLVAACVVRPPPPPPPGDGGTDSAQPPTECNDGIDNDGDGIVDYPNEPGCTAPTDPSEDDPLVPPQCSNALDDDSDGFIDYPNDPGCLSAGDNMEEDPPQCADGVDNDADGAIDYPDDPGCVDLLDDDETNPQCSDGIDNDGDGATDYPSDPDCDSVSDDSETGVPECMDSIDNDADALVDWPIDPGCISDTDDDEFNPPFCAGGVPVTDITASGSNMGTITGTSMFDGSCGGSSAPESIFWVNPPFALESMSISATGSGFTPLLYVQTFCGDSFSELACANNSLNLTSVTVSAGGYFIFLDGTFGSGGSYTITVSGIIAGGQPCDPASTVFTCNATLGFTCVDLGSGPFCTAGECSDGMDNDGDGNIDYPDDPGCDNFADNDETTPAILPECADGVDNDGDALVDYPADNGCTAASDNDESCTVWGTDSFGYVGCEESMVTMVPCEDISSSGTAACSGDDCSTSVPLPFTFDFYGTPQSSVSIISNGKLGFPGTTAYSNSCTIETMTIAPYWDDLYPPSSGSVRYQFFGTSPTQHMTVQWAIPHIAGGSTYDIRAVLYEGTNNIDFCYLNMATLSSTYDYGASATVGISGGAGQELQYSCNSAVIFDDLLLRILHP